VGGGAGGGARPDRGSVRSGRAAPAGLGWALGLLGAGGVHQDGGHVAAGGQLVEPVQRQQRPLPAALPRADDLDGHALVAVGQLPDFLGQDIQGDGSLVLGVLVDDELGELLLACLLTGQVGDADLLDRHGWPPRSVGQASIARQSGVSRREGCWRAIGHAEDQGQAAWRPTYPLDQPPWNLPRK
jgi:hypothetical protein